MVSDLELRKFFQDSKSIAVVGLSPVPARPSYGVTRYMMNAGYEIFGVRPASPPEILGRPCVESLAQLSADIDIIDVFRNSDAISGLVDEIAIWLKSPAMVHKRKPKLLWLQEGVRDAEAEAKAEKLGLKVIADKCILKEHARLI
jgi:predicted CoA-binding protein